ncbi:MFS transporter [Hoylesella oralis]|uniref:MFS transporter n=1 Tax=Hoylesella oralis TaxID=28134 RepID=UPI00361ED3A8
MNDNKRKSLWVWIPSLYFTEGLPYAAVMMLSVVMYAKMGISNAAITFWTGLFGLPWVIKPLWSPFVDIFKTKRWWIVTIQFLMGCGLAGIAFVIPMSFFFQATLAIFFLLAFSSSTHDIAADGFYLLALNEKERALWVGIRSTFYRVSMVVGQGLLVIVAGWLEKIGTIRFSWTVTYFITAGFMVLMFLYHRFILPHPASDVSVAGEGHKTAHDVLREFLITFKTFFKKRYVLPAVFFMLFYRLPESLLQRIISPFLLDRTANGGLGISTEELGWIYGIFGVVGLLAGGIIGGIAIAKGGLKRWLWPMACSIMLSCGAFVYLSMAQPSDFWTINALVFIEQFGYGFGFTAYMLYLMEFSEGAHKTAHYAFCTGLMALGNLAGMVSGAIQERIGYQNFFLFVMSTCLVTILVCLFIRLDLPKEEDAEEHGLHNEQR